MGLATTSSTASTSASLCPPGPPSPTACRRRCISRSTSSPSAPAEPVPLNRIETDVVVVGGGAAGVAAPMAGAGRGSSVVLLERGTSLGGELIGGLPILSVANARGEWIVGGVGRRLLEAAEEMDGYAGLLFDGRAMWGACVDPEVMKLVVIQALAER